MKKLLFVAPAAFLLLSGCASITTGSGQTVAVNTGHITGAKCKVSNSRGTWYVDSTPGSVMLKRSDSDLTVSCETATHIGHARASSHTKGRALGNLLCGGIIGGAVDMSTGSAYEYPPEITVTMQRKS